MRGFGAGCHIRMGSGFRGLGLGLAPGLGWRGGRRGLLLQQLHDLGADHLFEPLGGQRVGLGVVVDVDVQTVHHIEAGIGEELFHRCVLHIGGYRPAHKWREVRFGREFGHVLQAGSWRGVRRLGGRASPSGATGGLAHSGGWGLGRHHSSRCRCRTGNRASTRRSGCRAIGQRYRRHCLCLAARPAAEKAVGLTRHGDARLVGWQMAQRRTAWCCRVRRPWSTQAARLVPWAHGLPCQC